MDNQKSLSKISIGSVIVVTIISGYFFLVEERNISNQLLSTNKEKFTENKKTTDISHRPTPPLENEIRTQALKKEADVRYQEILNITGPLSGKRKLKYEDDWCIASQDLTEEDQAYAFNQLEEWNLQRGNINLTGIDQRNDYSGSADTYLDPYKEMDKETLTRLAKQDDMLALTTIVQSHDYDAYDEKTKLNAAKRLVTLGDTSIGLRALVIDQFVEVGHSKRTPKGDPIKHLKTGLALIEFGMMRNDVSNLSVFLSNAAKYKTRLEGVNPLTLTESDYVDINKIATDLYKRINQSRINMSLPSFEGIDDEKISRIQNDKKLFWFYNEYPTLMEGTILPASWKETYLKKSPCVVRRISMHNFLYTRRPAIEREIAELEKAH